MQNKIYKNFYKEDEKNTIWRVEEYTKDSKGNIEIEKGSLLFSFDKIKVFNLWTDYPNKLTPEEKRIFDKENPYWKNFFKDRR